MARLISGNEIASWPIAMRFADKGFQANVGRFGLMGWDFGHWILSAEG